VPSQDLPPVGGANFVFRVPPPGVPRQPTHKNVTHKNFNTQKQTEARFQYGGLETELEAFDAGLNVTFPTIDTSGNRTANELTSFEVAERAERDAFGPMRPRGKYDLTEPIGRQYNNNSSVPIDFQGNRRGGMYASGDPVDTGYASFTGDLDLVEDPTTSTNVNRPRTLAAAYSPEEEKLTVIFRDNTYYNYYEVTEEDWADFKKEYSKGKFILERLNGKPRGAASMGEATSKLLGHVHTSTRLRQVQKLTKGHAHGGKYRPAQSLDIPKIRKISQSPGYRPRKLVKPRGMHVVKGPSRPVAPTSNSVNAQRRRNIMRAINGK
jgi:hypothetical protein